MGDRDAADDRGAEALFRAVTRPEVAGVLRRVLSRRKMPDGLHVEDLVQESLAAVWQAVVERRLVDAAAALPYSLGVAHHLWVDAVRRANRRPGREWNDEEPVRNPEEWMPCLVRDELERCLQGLLGAEDARLFLALRWDGLKLAEAAGELGWSERQAEAGRRRIQRFLSDPVHVGRLLERLGLDPPSPDPLHGDDQVDSRAGPAGCLLPASSVGPQIDGPRSAGASRLRGV